MSCDDIINEVQKYPVLYNNAVNAYKYSVQKENAWKAIAQRLNMEGKYIAFYLIWKSINLPTNMVHIHNTQKFDKMRVIYTDIFI